VVVESARALHCIARGADAGGQIGKHLAMCIRGGAAKLEKAYLTADAESFLPRLRILLHPCSIGLVCM